jgi:signal transduction histidine kinase
MTSPIGIETALRAGIRRVAIVSGILVFVVASALVCLNRYESVARNVTFISTQMMRQLVRHSSDEDGFRLRRALVDLVDDFQKHVDTRLSYSVSMDGAQVMSSDSAALWRFDWVFEETLPNGARARVSLGVDASILANDLAAGVSFGLLMSLGFLLLLRHLVRSFVVPVRSDLHTMRESRKPLHFHEFVRFFEALEESRRLKSYEVVAQTTQALAHDVRKPFALVKSILQVALAQENPALALAHILETMPEVERAFESVEGLIEDVMQIGTTSPLRLDFARPSDIFEPALRAVARLHPDADVRVTYELRHGHGVRVDLRRVERVFLNILENALQAMEGRGEVWIRTLDAGEFVRFTVGNSRSSIPPDLLPSIFDAFVTSGKKGGTGLGLAIVKRAVEAHGGNILCESLEAEVPEHRKVEFAFTLPRALDRDLESNVCRTLSFAELRSSTPQIAAALPSCRHVVLQGPSHAQERRIPLLAHIEDSTAFLTGFRLKSKGHADVREFRSPSEFQHWFLQEDGFLSSLDVVLTDFNFGTSEKMDGGALAKWLREAGFEKPILLTSNAEITDEELAAYGFSGRVSKPLRDWSEIERLLPAVSPPEAP